MPHTYQRSESDHTIRILVAEDEAIVRRGIASLLKLTPEFSVAGEAENGIEAVERTLALKPDVVLMDIHMPLLNGVDAAAKIKAVLKEVKILMLTAHEGEDFVMKTIASGADGYLLKKATPESLSLAIRSVVMHGGAADTSFYSPSFAPETIQRLRQKLERTMRQGSDLTQREREVLQLIAEGKSHQEICELLHVSVRTVDTHRNNLMQKLKLHDAVALVRYAVKTGLTRI